jgi:hypothetical protein
MRIIRTDLYAAILLTLIGIISRVPFVEKVQSFWDGPQYTIGLIRYSFVQQTPAAPGYPYFIGLGKLFHVFIQDPHTSIVAVGVLASILGAITLYFVGLKMFNRFVGIAATTIFLTGSTFYYFSITPEIYDLLIVTIPLLAYSVYRIFIQKKQEGLFLGLIIGLYIGLRPQDIMQIGILFLIGFFSLSTKEKIKASVIFVIVTLSWFIPVVLAVGFTGYFEQSLFIAKTGIAAGSFVQHADAMVKGLLLSFGISPVFLVYYLSKRKQLKKMFTKQPRLLIFYAAWIVPGFLYNLLLRSDAVGYQFSYLTALLFITSYAIWQVTRKNRLLYIIAITCIGLFNLFWFFYDRDPTFTKPYRPISYHYSELRENDIKTGGKVTFVQQYFNPRTTMVITDEVMWRPYSYYLKNYDFVVLFRLDNNAIPYSYNRIDSVNWNMHWYTDTHFAVLIPYKITNVVFMDDAASSWVKQPTKKIYKLPGNSTITSFSVKPGDTVVYDYKTISLKK